jgi:hypothetical protein
VSEQDKWLCKITLFLRLVQVHAAQLVHDLFDLRRVMQERSLNKDLPWTKENDSNCGIAGQEQRARSKTVSKYSPAWKE